VPEEDVPEPSALSLSEIERTVLAALKARESSGAAPPLAEGEVAALAERPPDAVRGALQRLKAKGLLVCDERHREEWRLTERGEASRSEGLPERRLLNALAGGPRRLSDIKETFAQEDLNIALGQLKRKGLLSLGESLSLTGVPPSQIEEEVELQEVSEGHGPKDRTRADLLVRRGLLRADPRTERFWSPSPQGRALSVKSAGPAAVGPLTGELLLGQRWEQVEFRPYDVRAPVPYLGGARGHPYLEWLRQVEEVLVGLGFEQYLGPLVEQEFYNNDLLFMPQAHPARSLQDMLALAGVEGAAPPGPLLRAVSAVHEGRSLPRMKAPLSPGWQTPYNVEIAKRVVLRSQTTAATARYLASHPKAPFRMYSLDLVFRRDAVDAQHHLQFHQAEGVMGARGLNFRHLLGLLEQFTHALGIREVRFQPTYFPFTEPSVQGMVRHPTLGWIEALPGGMFRPEVLRPLGVKVPTAAWGIGIGRLALVALGVNDIRELFLDDLPRLSEWRVR
jgi:phenylalanyl-tRNA synthetase alpha chain